MAAAEISLQREIDGGRAVIRHLSALYREAVRCEELLAAVAVSLRDGGGDSLPGGLADQIYAYAVVRGWLQSDD